MLKQIDQRTVSDNKSEFNADAIIKELENIQQYDQNTINTLRRIFNQIRQHISPTNIDRLEVLSQFCRTSWFFLHYVKPENKFNDDITNFSREVLDYLLRVLSSSDFYNFNNGDTYDNQRLFTDTFYEVLDLSSLIFTLINDERKARTFIDILIRNQHNITQSSLYTPSRFSENLLGIVNIAYTTNEAKQQFLLSLLENLKYDLLLSMINNLLADKQFWENSTELKGIFAESLFLQIFDHYKHAYNEHNENLKFLYSQIINRLIEESQEAVDNIVRILKSGKKDDIEPLIDLLENVKVSELRIKSHTKTNLEQLVSVIKDLFADVFINRKINLNSESQKLLLLKRLWVESTGTIYEFISNSILRNCSVEMMAIAYGYMLNIVVDKDIDKVIDFFLKELQRRFSGKELADVTYNLFYLVKPEFNLLVDYLLNNFDKLPENLKAGIIFFLFENYRDFFKRSYQNLQSEELVLEERLVKLFDKLLDGINSNVEYYSLACAYACDRLSFAGLNSSLAFYSIDAKNNDQVSKLEHDLRSIGFTQIELNFLRLRLQSQNDKFSIRNFEFVVSSEGNVRIFRELRKEYFQKIEESNGSAAGHLHRTHGINFFGRYTFQLLKGQLETNYDNYVLVVSSNLYDSDHNGAFYNSNSEYEEFLRAGIGVVLIEASDESSFEKLVEDFSSRNKDKTAHALFLQFHGNKKTAFFGTEKSESLTIDTTDKDLAQFIKSILAPSATIVFRSCSTGKELAGFIHVNTGNIKTIAPLGDTDIQDISNVQFQDKDKILKFSVVYYHPHVIFESNRSQ